MVIARRVANPGLTVLFEPSFQNSAFCVADLKGKGISAVSLPDAISKTELDAIVHDVKLGHISIIVCPPQYMNGETLAEMRKLPGGTLQVVVHEAYHFSKHSMSQHRAAYLRIPDFVEFLKPRAVLLHADGVLAKALVDICEVFQIPQSSVSRLAGLPKPNVQVEAVSVERNHDKFSLISKELLVGIFQIA